MIEFILYTKYYSKISLREEKGSIVSVGASPEHKPLPPLAGSKRLTRWTSETVY
jgi:hypothetical protein